VIREYLNACDAWFIPWSTRDSWIIYVWSWKFRFPEVSPTMTDSKRDAWILLIFVRETGSRSPLCHPLSQLSENILGKHQWYCPEIPSDSKWSSFRLENEFSEQTQISLNSRLTGMVFITRYTAVWSSPRFLYLFCWEYSISVQVQRESIVLPVELAIE